MPAENAPNTDIIREYLDGSLAADQIPEAEALIEHDPSVCTALDRNEKLETFIGRLQESLAVPPFPAEKHARDLDALRRAVAIRVQQIPKVEDAGAFTLSDSSVGTDSQAPTGPQQSGFAFLSPPQGANEIGRLNGYRVLKLLGQGGMGVVFEAEDVRLKRRVALKVMKPEVAAKEEHRERFIREAQTAARVEHDFICPIYQVGEENGVPFIAMPFLKGEPLDARLKRQKPLPLAEAIRIGREVAEGLAEAHKAGLIHRDIKPGNIWQESLPNGRSRCRILDFGLARITNDDTHLTQSGAIMGTPAYMAPEQARARPVDHRADLFSLGVMLYEMTTGRRPFIGADTMSVLTSLALDEPPAPSLINPQIPAELAALIVRLISKSPDNRPASGQVVAEALLGILTQTSRPLVEVLPESPAPPLAMPVDQTAIDPWQGIDDSVPSEAVPLKKPEERQAVPNQPEGDTNKTSARRSTLRWGILAASLFLLVGGGFAAYKLYFETKDGMLVVEAEGDADVRFKNGELQIFDADGKLKYTLTPSERNKKLPPGKYQVKIVSPDGVKIESPEFVMEKNGKASVRVVAAAEAVVAGKNQDDPKDSKPVASPESKAILQKFLGHTHWVRSAALSRDGKYVVTGSYDGKVILREAAGGKIIQTIQTDNEGVAISDDGKVILTGSPHKVAILWDSASGKKIQTLEGHHTAEIDCVALSGEGKLALTGSRNGTAVLWEADNGKKIQALIGHTGPIHRVALSRDGKYAVTGSYDNTAILWEAATAKKIQTFQKGHTFGVYGVAVSDDGKFVVTGDGNKTAFLWDAISGNTIHTFTGHTKTIGNVALSGDNKLVLTGSGDRTAILWDATSGRKLQTFEGHTDIIHGAALSQDGKLALTASYDKTAILWAVQAPPDVLRKVNLLALLDAKKDFIVTEAKKDVASDWSQSADGLKSPASPVAVAEFPYVPPDEYDFRIEFTGVAGFAQSVNQFLSRRDRCFSFITNGGVFGLEMIGGKCLGENASTINRPSLSLKERHICISRVRNDHVSVELDGKELLHWKTDFSDLSLDHSTVKHWANARRNRALLAVGTSKSETIFHRAEVVEISGKGTFFRPEDPAVIAGKWKVEESPSPTLSVVQKFEGHTGAVRSVALTRDGKYAVTGSLDGTAILWDTASGNKLQTFKTGSTVAVGVAVSDDGKIVATQDHGQTLVWDAVSGKILQTFNRPPGKNLNCLALSGDGKKILIGSGDKTAVLWEAASGKKIQTFPGHHNEVWGVCLSRDGRRALTMSNGLAAGDKDILTLWDAESGNKLQTFQAIQNSTGLALSGDGKYALSGRRDKSAILWDAASGKELKTLNAGGHKVALSDDGKYALLTASYDNTATLWDAASGKILQTLKGHNNWILGLAISGDGKYVLTGSDDKTAVLWQLNSAPPPPTESMVQKFEGHTGEIRGVALSGDGKYAVTGSGDRTAILWDAASGKKLQHFVGHTDKVQRVALNADGTRVLTGSLDKTAILWDAVSGKYIQAFRGHANTVVGVALSGDGARVLTGSTDKTAILWDAASGKKIQTFQGHTESVHGVALSSDGKLVLTASADKTAMLWDVASGKEVQTFRGHTEWVHGAALSSDNKLVLTGSYDSTAILWDAASGKKLQTFVGHVGTVYGVALSGDGKLAVTGAGDKTAILWEAASGKKIQTFQGHTGRILGVAMSNDGKRILSGSDDKTAILWAVNAAPGSWQSPAMSPYDAIDRAKLVADPALPWRPKELIAVGGEQRFDSWGRYVTKVHLSKDGKTLYASSQDGTITIRDAESGRVRQLFEHQVWYEYGSAAFAVSPDDRWLVYQKTDKDLVVWDLKENRNVKTLTGAGWDLAFSADGKWLLAASWSKLRIIEPAADWNLKHEIDVPAGTGRAFITVSRDSKRAAVIRGTDEVTRVRAFDIGSGDRVSDFQIERRINFGTFGVGNDDFFFGGYTHPKHLIGRFDLKAGKIVQEKEYYNTQSMALSPDGKQLLVSQFSNMMAVNPDDLSRLWQRALGNFGETRIAVSADGGRFAIGDSTGLVSVHDVAKKGEPVGTFPSRHAYPYYRRFFALRDGRAFLSGENVDSWLLDFKTGKDAYIPRIVEMDLTIPAPDLKQLFVALPKDKSVAIVDWQTGKPVRELKVGLQVLEAVPFDGGRKLMLRTKNPRSLAIADTESGVIEKEISTPECEAVHGMAVDPVGRRVALARKEGVLDVFDIQSAKLERSIELKGPFGPHPVFSRDGQWLACGHSDASYGAGRYSGKVLLLAAATGEERKLVIPKDCRPGHAVDISPDSEELANGGFDGSVHFWDIKTGSHRRSIRVGPANGVILHVAYAPDGRHLLVYTPSGMVLLLRLADAPTGSGNPGQWQSMLDPKLTKWGITAKEPGRVEPKPVDGETVVQFLNGGFLWPKFVVPDHHLRLKFQFPGKQPSILRGSFGTQTGSSVLVFHVKNSGDLVLELNNASANDAILKNGDFVSRGAIKSGGTQLGNSDLGPPGTWNRLDIVRVGDRLAFFLNGRFINAVANLRWLEKEKQIEPGKGALGWSGSGEVLLRRIEVRDINALPPELLAGPADRKAAEALLPHCRKLTVRLGSGEVIEVKPQQKLPEEPFTLVEIAVLHHATKNLPADFVESILLPAVAELRSLEAIDSDANLGFSMSPEQLRKLLEMPAGQTLKRLHGVGRINNETMEIYKRFPNLSELGTNGHSINDKLLQRLAELPKLSEFSVFQLAWGPNKCSKQGLAALCKLPLKKIVLDDFWQPDGPRVDREICALFAAMPTLQSLHLTNCDVGDEVLPELARCKALATLGLHGAQRAKTEITDAGLEHLKGMTNLRELAVRGANVKVTETGAMKLAAALPQCLIRWGDGKTIQPKIGPERKTTDKE
jgi:WD40 repeat protein/serine/threonine protein kinase